MDINISKLESDLENGTTNNSTLKKISKFYRKLENRGVSHAYLIKDITLKENRFVVYALSMSGDIDTQTVELLRERTKDVHQVVFQRYGGAAHGYNVSYYDKNGVYDVRQEMSPFAQICSDLPGVFMDCRMVNFTTKDKFKQLDYSAAAFGYGKHLIGIKGMQLCLIQNEYLESYYL